jgi:MoaA/NifB/PqqE/SkfB family radical SAM enzyme
VNEPVKCYYALGGINYKNGFVTSCPQQSDQLYVISEGASIKPSDIINSENFKKHRLEMMSGTWSQGCHLCKEVEENNAGRSMRMDYLADEQYYNAETGEIDYKAVKHVELRFSNSCNMACLHCSDVYSSGWMSKLKHYVPDEEDKQLGLIQLTRMFHRVSADDKLSIDLDVESMAEIVNDLNTNFPNLEKVDFAGGEVLYQKQFFPCLELLAIHPNAFNIRICFHSNFNAKADMSRLYTLLQPFSKDRIRNRTTIMMSLDAGKNIYSYFRTGDWEVLKENVRKFKECDVNNDIDLNIVCTTSAYQIMDLVNVIESFLELDVNVINSSIVYYPDYINPALMMLDYSEYVLADIKEARKVIMQEKMKRISDIANTVKMRAWHKGYKTFTDLDSATEALDNIETYVINNPVQRNKLDSFMAYIRKSDVLWKQHFNDHFKKYRIIDNKITRITQ